ncbi:hypothetical protein [Streptacidiphilus sp. PAMC 29251]
MAATALPPQAAGKRTVGWNELTVAAGQAALVARSSFLTEAVQQAWGRPLTGLPDLLDGIDAGQLDAIAAQLPTTEAATGATGRAAREIARTAARHAVRPLVLLALVDSGRARFVHSWDEPLHLDFTPPALTEALTEALDALVASPPNTGPLRALLAGPQPG